MEKFYDFSTPHIWVNSWCCTFYGFGQMYNDMYTFLWYHTECIHCPKNPLCFAYSSLLQPLPLTTTDLFIVSIVLTFPKCHIEVLAIGVSFVYALY